MIRVLEIIDTLGTGGAEVLLCDLALQFRLSGVAVEILCLTSQCFQLENRLTAEGIKVIHSPSSSPYSPFQILAVKKQIAAGQYDLIHSHLFPAQLWTCLGALLAKPDVPLVTTEHSTWNRRRRQIFRPLDQWMYARYAVVACIGEATESALRDWVGRQSPPTMVVPNGIDVERFVRASGARTTRAKTNCTTLICVASLTDSKGHEVLLRAVGRLANIEVLLVGDGPKRLDLERLAANLGIAGQVRFLGNRSDVPALLAAADIYIQPSCWEGFGIATLEAMAAGLPVVASDVPGLRDVVGDAGLLFKTGSAADLTECVARLMSDPDLRSRLASLAQKRSRQFSIQAAAAAYVRLYKSVIEDKYEIEVSRGSLGHI